MRAETLGRCEPIDGRPRWPSTESIAKIPAATQTDIGQSLEFDMRRALRSAPKVLERKSAQLTEAVSLNPALPTRTLATDDVEWMARVVWAGQ